MQLLKTGFNTVKVNAVLMKNINDINLPAFLDWIKHRPIQLRFIELMETGKVVTFSIAITFLATLFAANYCNKAGNNNNESAVTGRLKFFTIPIIRVKLALSCPMKKIFA